MLNRLNQLISVTDQLVLDARSTPLRFTVSHDYSNGRFSTTTGTWFWFRFLVFDFQFFVSFSIFLRNLWMKQVLNIS